MTQCLYSFHPENKTHITASAAHTRKKPRAQFIRIGTFCAAQAAWRSSTRVHVFAGVYAGIDSRFAGIGIQPPADRNRIQRLGGQTDSAPHTNPCMALVFPTTAQRGGYAKTRDYLDRLMWDDEYQCRQ
jgi:hypothetical protein